MQKKEKNSTNIFRAFLSPSLADFSLFINYIHCTSKIKKHKKIANFSSVGIFYHFNSDTPTQRTHTYCIVCRHKRGKTQGYETRRKYVFCCHKIWRVIVEKRHLNMLCVRDRAYVHAQTHTSMRLQNLICNCERVYALLQWRNACTENGLS